MAGRIEDAVPGISIDDVSEALSKYQFDALFREPLNAADKAQMAQTRDLAIALHRHLVDLPWSIRNDVEKRLKRLKPAARFEQIGRDIERLAEAVTAAEADISPSRGRPPSAKTALARDLAGILEKAGHVPSPAAKGPLVYLMRELMVLLGEPADDVRSDIRRALGKKPRKQPN